MPGSWAAHWSLNLRPFVVLDINSDWGRLIAEFSPGLAQTLATWRHDQDFSN